MHGGDTSSGTPRNELSVLNHQMFESPAPAEKGGGLARVGALLGTLPKGLQTSQLQFRRANQAQGSGFFWSQATLQGPSYCSGPHRSQTKRQKQKEVLARDIWHSAYQYPPTQKIQGGPGLFCSL